MFRRHHDLCVCRAPGIRVLSFHGGTKRERERSLQKIHRRGGVALTSYGMLVHNAPQLAEKDGREFVWVRRETTAICVLNLLHFVFNRMENELCCNPRLCTVTICLARDNLDI